MTAASTPSPSASRPPLPLSGGEEKAPDLSRLPSARIIATDTPLTVRAAPDFSAFAPLDFAPPDRPGAVVGDPASDVVTIHVRRPSDIAGAADLWLTFQTDDAADLAARIADIAGGDRRRAGLIAFALVAWAGAIVGSLLTILAFGVLQP